MHYERFLLYGDRLLFYIKSPRWFELAVLHPCRMLFSGKHGIFSPILLLDALTKMITTDIWQTKLLRTCYAPSVSLDWCVLLINRVINRVCKCMFRQQAVLLLGHVLIHENQCWLNNWLWARESRDHLILPSTCSRIEEWEIKEECKDFSLPALFCMPFPVTVSFIPISPCAKTIVIIFPPSQTLCHEGVDAKLLSLAGRGEKKAMMDGVSTLLSVLTPDCFGWVSVSYHGAARVKHVSACFILLY